MVFQGAKFLIGIKKGILCNLLRDVKVTDLPPYQRVDTFLVFFYQGTERVWIPLEYLLNKFSITLLHCKSPSELTRPLMK